MGTRGEILLTAMTYDVLKRVPYEWVAEAVAIQCIATALAVSPRSVAQRIVGLRKEGLIELRRRQTIDPYFELRRIAKA